MQNFLHIIVNALRSLSALTLLVWQHEWHPVCNNCSRFAFSVPEPTWKRKSVKQQSNKVAANMKMMPLSSWHNKLRAESICFTNKVNVTTCWDVTYDFIIFNARTSLRSSSSFFSCAVFCSIKCCVYSIATNNNKLAPYGTDGRLLLTANFKVTWHEK